MLYWVLSYFFTLFLCGIIIFALWLATRSRDKKEKDGGPTVRQSPRE